MQPRTWKCCPMLTVAMRFVASLGLTCIVVVPSGCGESNGAYSAGDVIRAFREKQIMLVEIIEPTQEENPISVILGPAATSAGCEETDLRVNVFESEEAVEVYLRTIGQPIDKSRYDLGDTVGLVRGNLIVGTKRGSKCFSATMVERALDELR